MYFHFLKQLKIKITVMILPFLQYFDKEKPTYFAEKIIRMLGREKTEKYIDYLYMNSYIDTITLNSFLTASMYSNRITPKIHTIRKDEQNRWKVGNNIHAIYNNRSKNQFQFAPAFECKGIQTIEIKYTEKGMPIIKIDDKVKYVGYDLSKNDGFDCIVDFFTYFNTDFTGKIIHFTDFKY